MDTVLLKSRVGPVSFDRRTRIIYERGASYEMRKYRFDFDNDFKAVVPSAVWESLRDEFLDRKHGLKYREALMEL